MYLSRGKIVGNDFICPLGFVFHQMVTAGFVSEKLPLWQVMNDFHQRRALNHAISFAPYFRSAPRTGKSRHRATSGGDWS